MNKDTYVWDIDRKKERKTRIFGKRVPLWIVILLIVALIALSTAYAITASQRTYATLFGEVIDVTTDVTINSLMIDIARRTRPAVGDTPATAVIMANSNPRARTDLAKSNWIYQIELECITGTTPASTTFKVDLYVNSTLSATLYVASDADPATGERVRCRFDIGADLSTSASYMLVVTAM